MKNVIFLIGFLILFVIFSLRADPHFIFIAGGSASGKTTFAKALVDTLGSSQASYISLDEYLDKRIQPESDFIDGIPNFDNPSMINWALLLNNLEALQRGLPIDTPIYDFSKWMPVGFRHMPWTPVLIIEGIHATQDELDALSGLRVFIDVPENIRFQRRFIRDVKDRNYSEEMIAHTFFKMAVPYQKIFLDPTRAKANITIDTLDGDDYLEKAVAYVLNTFEKYKAVGFENVKIGIKYVQSNVVAEVPYANIP